MVEKREVLSYIYVLTTANTVSRPGAGGRWSRMWTSSRRSPSAGPGFAAARAEAPLTYKRIQEKGSRDVVSAVKSPVIIREIHTDCFIIPC